VNIKRSCLLQRPLPVDQAGEEGLGGVWDGEEGDADKASRDITARSDSSLP
jgi:hypothetical protein